MEISDLHTDIALYATRQQAENIFNSVQKSYVNLAFFTDDIVNVNYIIQVLQMYRKIFQNNKFLFSLENCDLDAWEHLTLHRPFSASLTWNYANSLAGGAFDTQGITNKGIRRLKEMEQLGILLDTAHLNKKSFMQIAERHTIVLNSHTGFSCVCKHRRNIDDEQISIIVQNNGLIGLTFVSDFLSSNKQGISAVIENIEYFLARYPFQNLAIGSDYWGTKKLHNEIKDYQTWPYLVDKLLKLGYNEEVISAIFCNNFKKFIQERYYD